MFGPRRLLFGTDFPISNFIGKCVSIEDGFFWLYHDNVTWDNWLHCKPTLVGIESLLAIKQAAKACHLNDSDVELIFGQAARSVLEITPAPDGRQTQGLYDQAKTIIPGGTQLLSKRPEMYAPQAWPAYFSEARGVEVFDLDGRRFVDMTTSGIGACLLGYADPDVNDAVIRRVMLGSASVLNSADEVALAKGLIDLHPWAQMARFARTGGEAMAVAVRIARAKTRRDVIVFCGYHGWQDWYLAANLAQNEQLNGHLLPGLDPHGVPSGLVGTAIPCAYNQLDELATIVREQGSRLAAIVMEPTRAVDPLPGYLQGVRELASKAGAVLVFDEITAGLRLYMGGAHLRYGVTPDIAVFGKALGNGVPISAIIGNERTMQAAQETFISSTMWTEGLGFAAGLATLNKLKKHDAPAHVHAIGTALRNALTQAASDAGLSMKIGGHPAITSIAFDHPQAAALMTLFTRLMLKHHILAGSSFYPSMAHEQRHVDHYIAAAKSVLNEVAQARDKGDVMERINNQVKHGGFTRLT